jgi:hypothetical protein
MDRRNPTETVAQNISDAIVSSGATLQSVADATDMHPLDLSACLRGEKDFTVSKVIAVGGFLRIRAGSLMEGAVA